MSKIIKYFDVMHKVTKYLDNRLLIVLIASNFEASAKMQVAHLLMYNDTQSHYVSISYSS